MQLIIVQRSHLFQANFFNHRQVSDTIINLYIFFKLFLENWKYTRIMLKGIVNKENIFKLENRHIFGGKIIITSAWNPMINLALKNEKF